MFGGIKRLISHSGSVADEHVTKELVYWQAARRVLPAHINEQYNHIELDDGTFMTCVIVGVPTQKSPGYPSMISPSLIGGLLDTAREHCAIGYSFAVRPFSQGESGTALEDAEFQNIADQMMDAEKNKLGHVRNKTTFVANDLREDQLMIHKQEVSMAYTSCIITIRGNTIDELDIAASHVRSVIKKNLVGVLDPYGRMLDAYRSAQPWGDMIDFATVDALTPQVAAMLPVRDPGAHSDETGVWFGTHKVTENEVMIDIDALATQHGLIVGPSGSGKTTAEIVLGMRFKDQSDFRVIYLTMKSDDGTQFRNAPAHYQDDGIVIDVGNGADKSVINPLQIVFDPGIQQSYAEYLQIYYDNKANVIAFLDAFIDGGLTAPQKNYVDDTLNRLYEKAGIISMTGMHIMVDPGTWDDGNNFPTIHLLRKVWHDDMVSGKLKLLQMSAESLYNNTHSLDLSGAYSYLNTSTTADFSKDFMVIDLSGLKSDLQDAMSILVTGIVNIRFRSDAEKRTLLIIDEGVAFVRNRERMNFVSDASMMGRSLRVAMMICFTQTADLSPELAAMLKTNSMWTLVLGHGMGSADAEYAQKFFRIPDEYMGDLINQPVGDGLLMVRNQIMPLHFTVTDQEMTVLKGTNGTTEKHELADAFMLLNQVSDLVLENGLCLDEWIDDTSADMMRTLGYEPHLVQRAFGNGKTKAWVLSDITDDGKIANQTLDHYAMVIQIAGHLMLNRFDDVVVSHFDDADVTARLGDDLFGFEYERAGSHTKKELQAKRLKLETTDRRSFFVCQSSYAKFVSSAVGEDCTYKRGAQLNAAIDAVLSDHRKGDETQ